MTGTEYKLYLEIVRDGKLFVNPLHLLVEEVRLSEVKCSEVKIGPSEFTVFFTGMWVVFDFMFGKQPAVCGWYSRDAMSVGFLLYVQGLFLVCEMLLWKCDTFVVHVHAVACNFFPHTTMQLASVPESSQYNNALWAGRSGE